MKLLTQAIIKKIPPLYSTDSTPDAKIVCKFFAPWSSWTWYVTEGQLEEDGDWLFFGLVVDGHEKELGYFIMSELESVSGPGGLKIERDLHFGNHRLLRDFTASNKKER